MPALPLKVKVVPKNVTFKTDLCCDIGRKCQGIIETKMEVGIRFGALNLCHLIVAPKYDLSYFLETKNYI